jgi:8-oxo-dGTP pyrophosphatase MutT (NUDIX family)
LLVKQMKQMKQAAFVIAPTNGGIAATTRAADRGEAGRIGLPGGKVESGETPLQAAIREAAEEGWEVVRPNPTPVQVMISPDFAPGYVIYWYVAARARRLDQYKEAGRIAPIVVGADDVIRSGYGNDRLPAGLLNTIANAFAA